LAQPYARRVRALVSIFAVSLGVLAAGSGAAGAARARCGPSGAHTLAASRVARVYALRNVVYGCSTGGAQYKLGHQNSCVGSTRVAPVTVVGRLAAYGLERCGVDTGSTAVVVRRLSDGRQLHSAAATSPPGAESYQSLGSLVLKGDGAVAWIGVGHSIVGHGPEVIEVRRLDRAGEALLDSGGAVASHSLRLHRSTLSWTHGGETRRARLH
jgi:hypothetical protein